MLKELQEKRAKAIADARAIFKVADDAKREATVEENGKFDAFMADADKLKAEIDRRSRLETEERDLGESAGRKAAPARPGTVAEATAEQRNLALRAWAKVPALGYTPPAGGSPLEITEEERAAAQLCRLPLDRKYLNLRLYPTAPRSMREIEERAAIGVGSAGIGGNTVANEPIRALETALLSYGGMREVAQVIRTQTGATLPWPTSNDTSNKGEIIAESAAINELEMTFGIVNFLAYKYSSKFVKVSVEFLQDTSIDFGTWIGARLGERIARILNDHLTTGLGSGSSQPKGITVAGTSAFTSASSTAVTADEVLDLVHSVDPSYRKGPSVAFMFNDSTLKFLRKLKDGEGRYLWQAGSGAAPAGESGVINGGVPDTLWGYKYVINQSMDSLVTAKKPMAFGDFSKYILRDVLDVTIMRLDELFAQNHQVGFLAFSRHDGNLVDAGTNPLKFVTTP